MADCLAQNGCDIDDRAGQLHKKAMADSVSRFGLAGWTRAIDENATLASHLAEASWWEDNLSLNEASLLMSEIISEMVRERRSNEEREAREATGPQATTGLAAAVVHLIADPPVS